MVNEVTKENFDSEVLKSDKPVVVDFWAAWCGPCRMLGPVLEEIADEMKTVKFVKLDTEQFADIASQYGVMSLPTMVVFKDGNELGRISGFKPKPQLKQELEEFLK